MKKLILLLYFVIYSGLYSQVNPESIYYGGGVFIEYDYHAVDFNGMPGYENCCMGFNNSSKLGISPYVMIGLEIFEEHSAEIHLGYKDHSIDFIKEDFIGNAYADDELHSIKTRHSLNTSLPAISSRFNYKYNLTYFNTPISLYAFVGLDFVLSPAFSQKEELVNNDFSFVGGSDVRNVYEGDISNFNSLLFNLGIMAGYDFKINKELSIEGLLKYNFSLNSFISPDSWYCHSIALGVKLNYQKVNTIKPPTPDTLISKPMIVYKNEEKEELIVNNFNAESYILLPNKIGYSRNQAIIPNEYQLLERDQILFFNEDGFTYTDPSEILSNTLNIIGSRMRKNQGSTLTISYYTNAGDDDKNIGKDRANNIIDYFQQVWDIKPGFLKRKPIYRSGGRILILSSDNNDIFNPIVFKNIDYVESDARKIKIKFCSDSLEKYSDLEIKFDVYKKNQNIQPNTVYDYFIEKVPNEIEINLSNEKELIPAKDEYIAYWFKSEKDKTLLLSSDVIIIPDIKNESDQQIIEFVFLADNIEEFRTLFNEKYPNITPQKVIIKSNDNNVAREAAQAIGINEHEHIFNDGIMNSLNAVKIKLYINNTIK